MRTQIVEQIELFSQPELESLEFSPEELEAIEEERVPDLDSISFEDIAKDLEADFEARGRSGSRIQLEFVDRLPVELRREIMKYMTLGTYQAMRRLWNLPDANPAQINRMRQNRDDFRMHQLIARFARLRI